MSSKVKPKEALEEALRQEELNYGEILSLAYDLSNEDQNSVRFSIDASHISRLGLELVSKQETAISELIKNAYDADAVTVDVVFKDSDEPGGTLEVIDSGAGMSREQLLNGFMRISTADKAAVPRSTIYGRQRAGRKGIGRFAAQRLGKKLQVVTQQQGASHSLQVNIDWSQFTAGLDLHLIANQILTLPPAASPGTTIKIEQLRDSWSEAQIRRAYRYVSDLLQPFPLIRKRRPKGEESTYADDPGFQATFYKEQSGDLVTIASDEQSILGHALAKITAQVDSKGEAYVSLSSDRVPASLENEPLRFEPQLRSRSNSTLNSYDLLSNVRLIAHYFIQDELPAGSRGMVREVLNRTGGIRVYRNGFRVLPYGESFDDWLGLQRSSALREFLPPHHNTNFIGFVEITDIEGMHFQETASREGLIENDAFIQLQDFVYRALVMGVKEIAHARNKKIFARDKPKKTPASDKRDASNVAEQASELANRVRQLADPARASSQDGPPTEEENAALSNLADEIDRIGANAQLMLEEVGMLRVLASLGLTIGEFTHEVRHTLGALSIAVSELGISTENAKLLNHVQLLRSYMKYFDNAVTENAHRKLEAHELRDVITEFVEVMRPTLTRQNIEVDSIFEGYDLFTRPMHKSEWASILLNLLTNSLKAIHRANVNGRIHILSQAIDDSLQIDFSDNGDGIPTENWDRIFEAFFTTSSPPSALAPHSEQLIGTGLGLKIVKDILEAAGGDIEVVPPPENFSTCIRLTVPRARKEQIRDEQY